MGGYAVKTMHLSKHFGKHAALEDIGLRVEEGTVYGLLGPNGAGKTTLLKLLVGLLRPTQGEILLFGARWRREQLGRIGAMIESPAPYGHLTGRENLEVHTRLLGLHERRIREVLELVGLSEAADRKVREYSMGMKQRLGIAGALLGSPELLILDEPANGLDPHGIRWLRETIREFSAQNVTVMLSSHILSEVARTADVIGVISDGRLLYQGTPEGLAGPGEDIESAFMRLVGEEA